MKFNIKIEISIIILTLQIKIRKFFIFFKFFRIKLDIKYIKYTSKYFC